MSNINESIKQLMGLDGAIACALVDVASGMSLGTAGGGADFDIEVAAACNTEVVRAKLKAMDKLGFTATDRIEDILITLTNQYHLIRPIAGERGVGLFFYVALARTSNLALARRELSAVETNLVV